MSCKSVVFSKRILPSACGEQSIALPITWVVWDSEETPLVNVSIRCTSFPDWKLNLIMRDIQLRIYLLWYLEISFKSLSYIDILGNFYYKRLQCDFSNDTSFLLLSLKFCPSLTSCLPPPNLIFFQPPLPLTYIHNYVFYFDFPG